MEEESWSQAEKERCQQRAFPRQRQAHGAEPGDFGTVDCCFEGSFPRVCKVGIDA